MYQMLKQLFHQNITINNGIHVIQERCEPFLMKPTLHVFETFLSVRGLFTNRELVPMSPEYTLNINKNQI